MIPDVELVILDYRMEPMDGMAVAFAVKDVFPNLPILLHSGQTEIPGALLDTVDGFVAKGFSVPKLISCAERLLLCAQKSSSVAYLSFEAVG